MPEAHSIFAQPKHTLKKCPGCSEFDSQIANAISTVCDPFLSVQTKRSMHMTTGPVSEGWCLIFVAQRILFHSFLPPPSFDVLPS